LTRFSKKKNKQANKKTNHDELEKEAMWSSLASAETKEATK